MDDLLSVFKNMNLEDDQEGMHYNSRVLLVDATNLFIRSYAAVPSMDDNGNHIGGMVGFLKSLGLAIRTFKPTRTIVVFDGKGGSQRRRKLYPEYKKNRKPPVRLNRSYDLTTDEEEKENMKFQLISLVEILENLPLTIFAVDHVEADDVIAYLSQLVELDGGKSIIYSTDKDFFQLASESVTVYNPVKKKTFDQEIILEEFGIHPKHFHFFRSLDGDKSDNINGVRGVGKKNLVKYVPEMADPNVFVDYDFIKQKYADVKKPPKMILNILDSKETIDRNIVLMDLHNTVMSTDMKIYISRMFHETFPSFDKSTLTKLMIRNKLYPSFPGYDAWVAQSFIPLNRFKYDATDR